MLLFELKDKQVQQFFLGGRYPNAETIRRVAETVRRSRSTMNESKTLVKPLERLCEALPHVGINKLRVAATLLNEIRMTRRTRHGGMKLIDDGEAIARIDDAATQYATRAAHDRAVLERMITYAQSARCRWCMRLNYFAADIAEVKEAHISKLTDELHNENCGVCDNCLFRRKWWKVRTRPTRKRTRQRSRARSMQAISFASGAMAKARWIW